jgi:hypothetical protein
MSVESFWGPFHRMVVQTMQFACEIARSIFISIISSPPFGFVFIHKIQIISSTENLHVLRFVLPLQQPKFVTWTASVFLLFHVPQIFKFRLYL